MKLRRGNFRDPGAAQPIPRRTIPLPLPDVQRWYIPPAWQSQEHNAALDARMKFLDAYRWLYKPHFPEPKWRD